MRYLNVCFLGLALFTLAACNQNDDTTKLGNWVIRADFGGDARYDAVSFVIGDTAYVGTGWGGPSKGRPLNDLWAYNPDKDNWTQMTSLVDPNDPTHPLGRHGAAAFAVNGVGYITTGVDTNFTLVQDTWAFDAAKNAWSPKAAYPGQGRVYAVGFGLKGFGFIGTGNNGTDGGASNLSDFYKYNPSSDSWTPIVALKDKRSQAVAFVINDSAYVVTGKSSNTTETGGATRMFVYDVDHDQWYEKSQIKNATDFSYDDDYSTLVRWAGVAFVMNNKGYITSGTLQNTWEYDPINDRWTEKTAFDAAARQNGVAFTVKNRGFVTTGASGSNGAGTWFEDMKEFQPLLENNVND